MTVKESYSLALSDWQRYKDHKEVGGGKAMFINALTIRNHRAAYSFWLRMYNVNYLLVKILAKIYYRHISRKFGLQIPPSTKIEEGLYIGHGIGIVINGKTKIGKNCNISQFLTIGSNKGTPATIGDNVYIGPHVCIVENVKIGNNVKIGAGTVVIHDVPDGATTVGNPNRIIIK